MESIKSPVIVTALFDIQRDKWAKFEQSYSTYLYWMQGVLSLDANIVIFTEEKFADPIKLILTNTRKDCSKTKLIILTLEELEAYKLYNSRLTELMKSESFIKKVQFVVPEMFSVLYNVITFNKVYFLKKAAEEKYFDNDLLIWMDAGLFRDTSENYNVKWPNHEKINQLDNEKITLFSHNQEVNVRDNEYTAFSQIRNIHGGCFLVPSFMAEFFTKEFDHTINQALNHGYIGRDETMFDITYCRFKSNYTLIKSGWREYFKMFL